jgi:hypothetical protein
VAAMVSLFHAARLALMVFDPYLPSAAGGSAGAAPAGKRIVDHLEEYVPALLPGGQRFRAAAPGKAGG